MNKKLVWTGIIGLSFTLAILIGNYYYTHTAHDGICTYNPTSDRAFILQLFKKNWHWLVSEYSTDFSAEYMLDNKASSQSPEHNNNLSLMVYRVDNKPVGFTAYYQKSFYMGFILFLVVDEEHRKSGYASKLLDYGIQDLFNRGCTVIQLITRVSNIRAQSLYKKHGFVEIWRDEEFVRFEKTR
ncbi:MAG: GNAT family N-acetyltransferase [Candidatus Babeliaceae bacterium]|jgi:ribosomal protein S18 acetylase RimI-like enzyme